MAYTTTHAPLGIFDRLRAFAETLRETAAQRSAYRRTYRELSRLTNRELADIGLRHPHEAYLEACQAPSPKSAQAWSHPAVYLAGRDSDWFFLANNEERMTWPVYRGHYQKYCAAVLRGETLTVPAPKALEKHAAEPLSREEQLEELRKLRDSSGL